MLKIGDFSKLANVTVKTLRLYSEMGLLRPAWIDRYTSYRYYSLDQLPRLNRILALKDLGLSLEQVRRVLDNQLSASELRGMLALKQAELRQKLYVESLRLERVDARLKQIEQEGRLHIEAVAVHAVEEMPVAFLRDTAAAPEQIAATRARARQEIEFVLGRAGIQPRGPWLSLASSSEYVERDIPVEVAVGLEKMPPAPLRESGRVMLRVLAGLPSAAVLAHTGPVETLPQAYATLYAWVESSGYRACGQAREVYLVDTDKGEREDPVPLSAAGAACIEVQLPVEPATLFIHKKEIEMEPKIIEYRELLVAGTVYEGDNKNQEIAVMWGEEFMPRIGEIKRIDESVSYGVCEMDPALPEGTFRYLAGVEIAQPGDAPADLKIMKVPGGKYAVVKHTGSLETLGQTYEWIETTWLPKSGYRRANRPDMEVYTKEFNDFQPDSVLYLYIPVE